MIRMEQTFTASPGDAISVTLPVFGGHATLPATLVDVSDNILRAQFDPLTLDQEEALAIVLYSRADTWLGWGEASEPDKPLTSLRRIFRLAFRGLAAVPPQHQRTPATRPPAGKLATSIVPTSPSGDSLRHASTRRPAVTRRHPKPSAQIAFAQAAPIAATTPIQSDTRSHPAPASRRSQPSPLSLLQSRNRSPAHHPHRLPRATIAQGPSSRRHRRLLVRNPRRYPSGPLFRLLGGIPAGNAIVISERASAASRLRYDVGRNSTRHRHAYQPLRPILQAPHPRRRFARRRPRRSNRPHSAVQSPQGATVRISSESLPLARSPHRNPAGLDPERLPPSPTSSSSPSPATPSPADRPLRHRHRSARRTALAEEIELYLTLMGHFGAQTGYPVLGVSVTNAEGMAPTAARRLSRPRHRRRSTRLTRLNPSLPVSIDGSGLHIQDTQGFFAPTPARLVEGPQPRPRPARASSRPPAASPDALIEAIEWPAAPTAPSFVILLRDKDAVPGLLSAFLKSSQSSGHLAIRQRLRRLALHLLPHRRRYSTTSAHPPSGGIQPQHVLRGTTRG